MFFVGVAAACLWNMVLVLVWRIKKLGFHLFLPSLFATFDCRRIQDVFRHGCLRNF